MGSTVLVLVACSDGADRPAPYEGLSNTGSGVPGSSVDASAESSTSDSGVINPGCGDDTQLGQEVRAILVNGVEPPLTGGAVQAGTYTLTEYVTYTNDADGGGTDAGPDPDNSAARFTMTIAGNTYTFVGVRGTAGALGADRVASSTFMMSGNTLSETTVCPVPGLTGAYPYRVDGNKLEVLYFGKREIYTRQ